MEKSSIANGSSNVKFDGLLDIHVTGIYTFRVLQFSNEIMEVLKK